MIVINVYYQIPDGKREEFMTAVRDAGILDKVYAEVGCRKYDFYPSWKDENELLLVERYDNAEALEFHMAQDHFKAIQEIEKKYISGIDVQRFDV